jgi:hypothetical protein
MPRQHRIQLQEHLRRAARIGAEQHFQMRSDVPQGAARDQNRSERLPGPHRVGIGLQPDSSASFSR